MNVSGIIILKAGAVMIKFNSNTTMRERLVIRVPKSHLETLEEISRAQGCSKSSIVRRLLSNFIEEETPQLMHHGVPITIEEARARGLKYPDGRLV